MPLPRLFVWMALALLLAACGEAPPPALPDGYEESLWRYWPPREGGNNHWYRAVAVPAGVTWPEAADYAAATGGYLATITSAAENDFVFALVNEPKYWQPEDVNTAGPWLGAVQAEGAPEPAGGWTWLNGDGPVHYANWLRGEPTNRGPRGAEDRIVFMGRGANHPAATWNDVGGQLPFRSFVIEYDTPPRSGLSRRGEWWAAGAAAAFLLVTLLCWLAASRRA